MDGEEDSYCDFEIIFSVLLNSSHYAKPWRRTQQQAHLYQVIIISFPCYANNHCLHSLHHQHLVIIKFNHCYSGIGRFRLTSAVDKACTRSLGKPREQWTVSLKVKLRSLSSHSCHRIRRSLERI